MSRMNWDRVRRETRIARGGSEWVTPDCLPPPSSARPHHPALAASTPSLENKEVKKQLQAQPIIPAAQTRNSMKAALFDSPAPLTTSSALSRSAPISMNPLLQPKTTTKLTKATFPKPALSFSTKGQQVQPSLPPAKPAKQNLTTITEMQKLAIRLHKAIGAGRMLQAASIASDLYGEITHCAEDGKS